MRCTPHRSLQASRYLYLVLAAGSLLALSPLRAQAPLAVPPARPAPLLVNGLGRATVALSGPWAFHPGDDPAWASPNFDDTMWPRLFADKTWEEQGFPNYTGYAWYRLRIVLDPSSLRRQTGRGNWCCMCLRCSCGLSVSPISGLNAFGFRPRIRSPNDFVSPLAAQIGPVLARTRA